MDGIKLWKYVGETSRSIFHRTWEHQLGLEYLGSKSFMLKHLIDRHEGEKFDANMFGVKSSRSQALSTGREKES